MATETNRPKIQIDDLVRDMTDDEYAALIASGWTPGTDEPAKPALPTDETSSPDA